MDKPQVAAAEEGLGLVLIVAFCGATRMDNTTFSPQNEFKLDSWVEINIAGIDMSINKAVLYIVLAALLDDLKPGARLGQLGYARVERRYP